MLKDLDFSHVFGVISFELFEVRGVLDEVGEVLRLCNRLVFFLILALYLLLLSIICVLWMLSILNSVVSF